MGSGVSRRRSARVRALGSVENRDPLTRGPYRDYRGVDLWKPREASSESMDSALSRDAAFNRPSESRLALDLGSSRCVAPRAPNQCPESTRLSRLNWAPAALGAGSL